jgi:hypothetical protein
MRGFAAAQAAYDNMLPPEYYEPEFDVDDCDGEECGECRVCVEYRAECAAEEKADAEYERRKEQYYE